MEYFYGGGGNTRPTFTYRFLVKKVTDEMWHWCEQYPLTGPFERWHVIHNYTAHGYRKGNPGADAVEIPLIQFESKKAARMFRIAYSEYIMENKSIYSLDD
jgi:hypothetical protein